ncbi:unnamed protein product [Adineta steineri]|uniref:Uncharacterized protein n=1 Tax=Adineta steineri TaxID=433720 RepID=A0A815XLU0_9BILA|nr:unnamed protein product [Adineta steineri]CAF1664319.1 unnamed protein product [Adineta steineri]
MNFLTTYEIPLRSYIQSRINVSKNALQEEDTITQVISRKYQHFKTLVLKLKSDTDKSNELDVFVDEIFNNLGSTLLSNSNDLHKRIKPIRPDPNDPRYNDK